MRDLSARVWRRFGVLAASLSCGAAASGQAAPGRNPVLLVHGIYDTAAVMQPLRTWLTARGWEVATLSMAPNDGSVPLEELARQVRVAADAHFPGGRKFDLVGFSMGGVVCRYYIQRLGGAARVDRFVCISAPNHGTGLAFLSNRPGCRQMRPGSDFLRDLNGDLSALRQVRFTSVWTPLDLMILPSHSSRLPVGAEIRRWVPAHPLMLLYPGMLRVIGSLLSQAPETPARWNGPMSET